MTRRLPPLTSIRALEAAIRLRSFTRAAEELHVTPAAVSQQVRQLEDLLGISLFRRGRELQPSEAALAALPLLSEGFDRLAEGIGRLHGSDVGRPLVVSCPPVFAARWLVPRLDDFQASHPEIELRLLPTRRRVDFRVEDVDAAVRFGAGPFAGLHAERLMPESIVPVAAPALAAGLRVPADLLRVTLLQDDQQGIEFGMPDWETWLASLAVSVDGALRTRYVGDLNLSIQAAVSGIGVALSWHSLVADELKAGRLVRLFDGAVPTDHVYHFVAPPARLERPEVVAFRNWLLAQAGA